MDDTNDTPLQPWIDPELAELAAIRFGRISSDLHGATDRLRMLHQMAVTFAMDVKAGYLVQSEVIDTLIEKAMIYGLGVTHGQPFIERVILDGFDRIFRPDAKREPIPGIPNPLLGYATSAPPTDVLEMARASEIQVKPIDWLWPSRIAIGKQALIAGEAGLGKSQVSVAMAVAVTTGGDWPCGEGQAPLGSVVILSAEDGAADTIVPRLLAAGAVLERVHIVSMVKAADSKGRRAFNLASDLELLERKIATLGDVRLVLIDPISSYLGARVDSHVNAAVRSVLEPIGEMAERMRVAVVCITHPPKGAAGGSAINQFIGSIAFVAAARSAFMVMRDPDDTDRRLFLPVKNNLAPLGKALAFRLEQRLVGEPAVVASAAVWDRAPVDMTADAALAAQAAGGGARSERDEAEEWLRERLAGGAVAVTELQTDADGAGLTWVTVRRAKKRLKVEPHKNGMDGGWTWELPKVINHAEGDQPLG